MMYPRGSDNEWMWGCGCFVAAILGLGALAGAVVGVTVYCLVLK